MVAISKKKAAQTDSLTGARKQKSHPKVAWLRLKGRLRRAWFWVVVDR